MPNIEYVAFYLSDHLQELSLYAPKMKYLLLRGCKTLQKLKIFDEMPQQSEYDDWFSNVNDLLILHLEKEKFFI